MTLHNFRKGIAKKVIAVLLWAALVAAFLPSAFSAEYAMPPEISAETAIVMDAETGQILYEKEMNKQMFPASVTKIMTVLLAAENGDPNETVTAHSTAVSSDVVPRDTSHIALTDGETLTLEDCVYAAMMPSANDAANVIAESIGGSLREFTVMMNEKAKEIGCENTHFSNANGLPDDYHMTTAYDMALITKYAMQNEYFRTVFGKRTYTISATNKNDKRDLATYHRMLKQGEYYYSYATGGKGGWTQAAQYTLVTTAEKNGTTLICVLFKSSTTDSRYDETVKLFDYCFSNFKKVTLDNDAFSSAKADVIDGNVKKGTAEISLKGENHILLHKSLELKDIVFTRDIPQTLSEKAELSTEISVSENEYMYKTIMTLPLDISISYLEEPVSLDTEPVKEPSGFVKFIKVFFTVVGIILLVAIVALIVIFIYMKNEQKKRAERRRLKKQAEAEKQERKSIRFYD